MALPFLAALLGFTATVAVDALVAVAGKPPDHCQCRDFKREIEHGKARCGEGKEYPEFEEGAPQDYRADSDLAREQLCNYFRNMDTSRCLNVHIGRESGTWCYVDEACHALNGGKFVPGSRPWKYCRAGRAGDATMREYSPEQLAEFARTKGVWLGRLVRSSYVGGRADKGPLVSVADFNGTIPDHVATRIRDEFATDYPVWLDTRADAKVPIVIVQGRKAWKVDRSARADPYSPGSWSALTCLVGC